MSINKNSLATLSTVNDLYFQPFNQVFEHLANRMPCPELADEDWLKLGIHRALEDVRSGRGFLQEHGMRFIKAPKPSNYFESLKSARRGRLAREANLAIAKLAATMVPDRLQGIAGLDAYEVFAMDGHWHRGATHDDKHKNAKIATGHFFSLNLRDNTVHHLATSEYHKENDVHVLKRLKPVGLRHQVAQGRRVLIVYDRGGIDFQFWRRCRKEKAVYFLSRVKKGMQLQWNESTSWDRDDPVNAGITEDRRVHTTENITLRVVYYTEPATGKKYRFLTNEMDLAPGVIAELYRRRWAIEKVYDEIKNKLGEQRSWSSDQQAKQTQGQLVALAYNLLFISQQLLEQQSKIVNAPEDRRREQRKLDLHRQARRSHREVSSLILNARRPTQCGVKFIRWLRGALKIGATVEAATIHLRASYAYL